MGVPFGESGNRVTDSQNGDDQAVFLSYTYLHVFFNLVKFTINHSNCEQIIIRNCFIWIYLVSPIHLQPY